MGFDIEGVSDAVTGYVEIDGYVVIGYVVTSAADTDETVASATTNTSMIMIRFFVFILVLCIVFLVFS